MECDYANALMMKYMDMTLTDAEDGRLNEHLAVCGTCREDYMLYKQLTVQFESESLFEAPTDLEERIMKEIRDINPDYITTQAAPDLAAGITIGICSIVIGMSIIMSIYSNEIMAFTAAYPLLNEIFSFGAGVCNSAVSVINGVAYGLKAFTADAVAAIESVQNAILLIAVALFGVLYVVRTKQSSTHETAL